jgi:ketosteroid isomerase-like protein
MAGRDQVVAEVVIEASTPTGGRFRDEELHLWTLGADGKVVRLRHYVDTAKHIAGAAGRDTTSRG